MTSVITDRLTGAVDGVPVQTSGVGIVTLTQVSGANAVQATAFPAITDWVENQIFAWRPTLPNTTIMTMTVDGIGASVPIRKPNNDPLGAADIQVGLDLLLRYDGTSLRIMGSGF